MKKETLMDGIGRVDEHRLDEAASYRGRKNHWKRWAALAACLVLVVGIGVPFLVTVTNMAGSEPSTNEAPGSAGSPDDGQPPAGLPSDPIYSVGEADPEFKKAMDRYEAFVEDYAAFMRSCAADSEDPDISEEYDRMQEEYAARQAEFDWWADRELTDPEWEYYQAVRERAAEKLQDLTE